MGWLTVSSFFFSFWASYVDKPAFLHHHQRTPSPVQDSSTQANHMRKDVYFIIAPKILIDNLHVRTVHVVQEDDGSGWQADPYPKLPTV